MPNIGLQTIEGQNDPALLGQTRLQGLTIHQLRRQQFVVAVEQVSDTALSHGDPTRRENRVDLGHAAGSRWRKAPTSAMTSKPNSCWGRARAPSASGR